MKTIMKRWRQGQLTTTQALSELGKLMAEAQSKGLNIAQYQEAVNQLIGMPDELGVDGSEVDRVAWESYRRG